MILNVYYPGLAIDLFFTLPEKQLVNPDAIGSQKMGVNIKEGGAVFKHMGVKGVSRITLVF